MSLKASQRLHPLYGLRSSIRAAYRLLRTHTRDVAAQEGRPFNVMSLAPRAATHATRQRGLTATGEERVQQSAGASLAKKVQNVAKKVYASEAADASPTYFPGTPGSHTTTLVMDFT